jgi:hypothetical protein
MAMTSLLRRMLRVDCETVVERSLPRIMGDLKIDHRLKCVRSSCSESTPRPTLVRTGRILVSWGCQE